MRIDGEITIAPTGHVQDYRITTPITQTMQEILGKSVHRWTFHPVLVDGKPVAAKSTMRITLAAREASGGYAVTVDNVTFRGDKGGLSSSSDLAPAGDMNDGTSVTIRPKGLGGISYPMGLMRAGVEGTVLLYLKVSPDGDVEDLVAHQSSLLNVRGAPGVLDKARKLLEDSAIAAARRWKFKVTVTGGTPTASDLTVGIPIQYVMAGRSEPDAPGQWRVELRSEKRIVPWLLGSESTQSIGISDIDNGDVMPIASDFKVPDGVIGEAL